MDLTREQEKLVNGVKSFAPDIWKEVIHHCITDVTYLKVKNRFDFYLNSQLSISDDLEDYKIYTPSFSDPTPEFQVHLKFTAQTEWFGIKWIAEPLYKISPTQQFFLNRLIK